MKTRQLLPERMDDPHLDRGAHFNALRGLQRINRWSGAARVAWPPIRQLARTLGRSRLSILDVATGAADLPIQLTRLARGEGIELDWAACDVHPQALEFAAENCQRAGVSIDLFPHDIVGQALDRRYDIVMCSTFLHHLTESDAVEVLRKMRAAAEHRVIVVDLVRGRWNWYQVWIASRILSRSPVVHFDGPQSIRAAFTVPEIRQLADRAGFGQVQLRPVWPCRFVMVSDVGS